MRWSLRPITWWKCVLLAAGMAVLSLVLAMAVWTTRHALAIHRLARGVGDTVFCTVDGAPWFRLDGQREDVPLSAMAPSIRQAVVAIEDHRFYRHIGLDPIGIGRAAARNVRGQQVVEGGSTLTQQLARTVFLSTRRSWTRKAEEAVLALMIERELPKDRVLELYLNRIYVGGGVYGVQPMARRLFGKPARALTLSESAVIAGLIRAPSALSPWSNPEGAIARSRVVLQRMREEGYITPAQEQTAIESPPVFRPFSVGDGTRSGYVQDYLRQQFRARFGGDHPADWKVRTSVVRGVQEAAERAVDAGLRRVGLTGVEAALVAFEPRSGNLLAMVGGSSYIGAPFNRATRSHRQPGSAFKPVVYAAALSRGMSPASMLSGLQSLPAAGEEEWLPRNVSAGDSDARTLRVALAESNNRAAVALQRRVGTAAVLDLATRLGLPPQPDVPSLALGTGSVTPFELTLAYAAFPNGGYRVRARSIVDVTDDGGAVVLDEPVAAERVLSEEVAFQMVSMLQEVVATGTGRAVRQWGARGALGGKTGTTDGYRDAWFVGFSSEIVAGVWVGFDQPSSLGADAYGGRIALPIWADFMRRASRVLGPGRPFVPPAALRAETLCRVSGLRPLEDCPTYTEYFKEGDEVPTRLCTVHSGSVRQRVERAVESLLDLLGRKLKGLFERR